MTPAAPDLGASERRNPPMPAWPVAKGTGRGGCRRAGVVDGKGSITI